jgi:glycosyltransferase involved in cell wall biosynthesis
MISIVIPVLNEEKLLPRLLQSLQDQSFKDYEVIVADAGSTDNTVAIAQQFGAKVVVGGVPSVGRNAGAKEAKGDIILFLDGDLFLPQGFLKNSVQEFKERNLVVASYILLPEKRFDRFLLNIWYNIPIRLLERVLVHGAMGIMAQKEVFDAVGGFDPTIRLAEDMYFVRQAAKQGKFGLFRSSYLVVSVRRAKQDGWAKSILRYYATELHMMLFGPVRSDVFKYRFDHYKEK